MIVRRCIMLSFLLISLTIGNVQAGGMMLVGQGTIISKQIPVADFSAVNVSADMQVKLIASTNASDVRLIGQKDVIDHVVVKVANGTLFLRMDQKYEHKDIGKLVAIIRARHIDQLTYHGRGNFTAIDVKSPAMKLTIDTPGRVNLSGKMNLQRLDLDGSGVININGLRSHSLTINSKGRDVVNLMGMANLRQLNFSGSGWLSMYWVNSPSLHVQGSGDAYVQLAGRVGTLEVTLTENAYFNGHYLRTDKTFIKTYDFARADLHVSKIQNALAHDQSNIYYYNIPNFHADYMADYGTVLNMSAAFERY